MAAKDIIVSEVIGYPITLWQDDWVPRDGGLLISNPINTPCIAHNIAPLLINPLINPYRNCLFLPFFTFEKHTASNTHHGRVALVSWLAPCHLWRGVQAQSRAGNGGGPGFPKAVVGEMGLGVTKDCDYILNMLSIFELGPKILMTHSLNWIGRCREMVGNLCA